MKDDQNYIIRFDKLLEQIYIICRYIFTIMQVLNLSIAMRKKRPGEGILRELKQSGKNKLQLYSVAYLELLPPGAVSN